MRIVVAGLAATYPLGGVFWDYLQYVQGFADLGHDVLYLEDTGGWCYDPAAGTMIESGERSAVWLGRQIEQFLPTLKGRWFFRDATGATFGVAESQARDFCRTADLFLNVSGAAILRSDELPRARKAYIDSDPMYSQGAISADLVGEPSDKQQRQSNGWRVYDQFLTFGENIGHSGCLIPTAMFGWKPTRQPVLVEALAMYRVSPKRRTRAFTTVGSWEAYKQPLVVEGRRYFGKHHEFHRFRQLPARTTRSFELALSGDVSTEAFIASGWSFVDPLPVSATAESYLRYLASSFAEWSVAKHAYVASRSGWFSGRSALYLALGVPVVVQDTGFSRFLPTGNGLLAFSTPDEALAAIEDVVTNYERHCSAAVEIAHEYFDAKRVLTRLIDDVFDTPSVAPVTP